MSKGPKPNLELLEQIRCYAAEGLSAAEAAGCLTTPAHVLTRNAVMGIAHRNGIKFHGKPRAGHPRPKPKHKPIRRTKVVYTRPATFIAPAGATPGAVRKLVNTKLSLACSWQGCNNAPDDGSMFCQSHGRRPLFG